MKHLKRTALVLMAAAMAFTATACGSSGGSDAGSDGKLTMQIWDNSQREAMQALADAYHEQNPDVTIEVQVTSWDEYWTKLEAAAGSGNLPDIFWMHTNQILLYADSGMLADVTDLYDNDTYSHYSDISIANTQGSDGRMYGVPKDKDTVCLVYNKEMFDQAGVAYPDENWTWDDLTEASQKIYDATGKYGYMAYCDEQLGYPASGILLLRRRRLPCAQRGGYLRKGKPHRGSALCGPHRPGRKVCPGGAARLLR